MHIILLLVALVIGAIGGYFTGTSMTKTSSPPSVVESKIVYDSGNAVRPTQSVRVSSCIPRMGYHWTKLEDAGINLEKGFGGPTYNVWPENGRVIGIEYHLPLIDAKELPRGHVLGKLGELNLFNARINHVAFGAVPQGHGGVPQSHWDVHFYLISQEEVNAITCVGAPPPATPSATAN